MIINKLEKCLSLAPKEDLYKVNYAISRNYGDILDFENAIKYAKVSYEQNSKSVYSAFNLGRVYLISNESLKHARYYLEKALNLERIHVVLGNLGHLELVDGNEANAIKYYKECVMKFTSITDFTMKFEWDLKYMIKLGITAEKYNCTKQVLINYWNLNKSVNK